MKIYSIFQSISGEVCSFHQGSISTFIRMAGCNVNCPYCDTIWAADSNNGMDMDIATIISTVYSFKCSNITITGGEPLEQKRELIKLVHNLVHYYNCYVSIETSGEIPFKRDDFKNTFSPFLSFVVDIKLNGNNRPKEYMNMQLLPTDFLKVVIGTKEDLESAILIKKVLQLAGCKAKFAFSPMYGIVKPENLLKWMIDYNLQDSILNIQIHKILNLLEDR